MPHDLELMKMATAFLAHLALVWRWATLFATAGFSPAPASTSIGQEMLIRFLPSSMSCTCRATRRTNPASIMVMLLSVVGHKRTASRLNSRGSSFCCHIPPEEEYRVLTQSPLFRGKVKNLLARDDTIKLKLPLWSAIIMYQRCVNVFNIFLVPLIVD